MEEDKREHFANTPKRKFRNSRDFGSLKDHAINNFNPQDNFTRASFKFQEIRQDIRCKMDDMNEIIQQEQSFLKKIDKYSLDDEDIDMQVNIEFVDNVNEYCDNNETMIV